MLIGEKKANSVNATLLNPLLANVSAGPVEVRCKKQNWKKEAHFVLQPSFRAANRGVKVDDSVLLIYTSGTTGLPKGFCFFFPFCL